MVYLLGWALNYYLLAISSLLGSRWRVFALASVVALGCLAIFRGPVGTDTVAIYEFMAAHIADYLRVEPGFLSMMYVFVEILNSPVLAVRAVAVVFTVILVIFVVRADKDELFYLMAFFIPTFFYSHSMNGLRIGMAFAVLLLALQCFRRREAVWTVVLAVVSLSFHYSALVVLMYFWLTEANIKSKRTLLAAVGAALVALIAVAIGTEYLGVKWNLYAESGYVSPSIVSGLAEVLITGLVMLAVTFSKLPRASRVRLLAVSVAFLLVFWGVARFSFAGLRLLELLSFALPFALLGLYGKYRIGLDQAVRLGLVVAGLVGMLSLYRNMVVEAQTIPDALSPFLPYRTLFEE